MVFHITAALPYNEKCRDIARVSKNLGFQFLSLPRHSANEVHHSYKHYLKFYWVLSEIKNNPMLRNNIIMFTDAYDVLPLLPASIIVSRFKQLNADFCLSAEGNFWPVSGENLRKDVEDFYTASYEGPHCYPNSGCWIGYGWAVEKILERACQDAKTYNIEDDQWLLQDIICYNRVEEIKIVLDIHQKIFTSMIKNSGNLYLSGSMLYSYSNDWEVGALHFNGYSEKWRYFINFYNELFNDNLDYECDISIIRGGDGEYLSFGGECFSLFNFILMESIWIVSNPTGNCFLMQGDGTILSYDEKKQFYDKGKFFRKGCVNSCKNMMAGIEAKIGKKVYAAKPLVRDIILSGLSQNGRLIKEYYNNMR